MSDPKSLFEAAVRGGCVAACKRRATGQCAPICLSHLSGSTTAGKCPEAWLVWHEDVDAILAAALPPDPAPEELRRGREAIYQAHFPTSPHDAQMDGICDRIYLAARRALRASLLPGEEPS